MHRTKTMWMLIMHTYCILCLLGFVQKNIESKSLKLYMLFIKKKMERKSLRTMIAWFSSHETQASFTGTCLSSSSFFFFWYIHVYHHQYVADIAWKWAIHIRDRVCSALSPEPCGLTLGLPFQLERETRNTTFLRVYLVWTSKILFFGFIYK